MKTLGGKSTNRYNSVRRLSIVHSQVDQVGRYNGPRGRRYSEDAAKDTVVIADKEWIHFVAKSWIKWIIPFSHFVFSIFIFFSQLFMEASFYPL